MKVFLRVFVVIISLALLFTQCDKDDPINSVDIPDDAFLNALIEEGVDTNGDSLISSAEAAEVTSLEIRGPINEKYTIKDLTGIEAFRKFNYPALPGQ